MEQIDSLNNKYYCRQSSENLLEDFVLVFVFPLFIDLSYPQNLSYQFVEYQTKKKLVNMNFIVSQSYLFLFEYLIDWPKQHPTSECHPKEDDDEMELRRLRVI